MARPSVIPAEELLVGEHHTRQVQGLQMLFATDREHAHALQHVTTKKFNLAKRFSAVNLGARTALKHRAWRSSCNARHNVERDMSSELCRPSTLRVCRGVSVTGTSISAKTSLVRRRFSGRDSSGAPRRSCFSFVLMLSQRPVWPHRTHLAWFSALIEPLAQLGNVLHCPINATTHGAKVASTWAT